MLHRSRKLASSVLFAGTAALTEGGGGEAQAQSAESAFTGKLKGALFYYQGPTDANMDTEMVTIHGDRVSVREALYHMGDSYSRFVAAASGGLMDINFDVFNLAITSDNNGSPWNIKTAAGQMIPSGYKLSDYTYVTPIYSPNLSEALVTKVSGVGDLRGNTSKYAQTWAYIGSATAGSAYYLHEFGHNLGLMHSGSLDYDTWSSGAAGYTYDFALNQYVKVTTPSGDSSFNYGMPNMPIGGVAVRQYGSRYNLMTVDGSLSPRQKAMLGWMPQSHFVNLNRVVTPGNSGTVRLYDDMADMRVVVTGTGADRSYSVEKGYANVNYNAYVTRQAQTFHVNADGVTGQWVNYAQTIDLYYRAGGVTYAGSDSPNPYADAFVIEINGMYVGHIDRGQTLLERGFDDSLFVPYMTIRSDNTTTSSINLDDGSNMPFNASKDILDYNGGNPGAPRNPNRYRTSWYKFTFLDSGVDETGHWGDLLVECLTGMDVAGWKWDAVKGTAGAQDGSGTWTTGAGNWANIGTGIDNQTWKSGEDAVFGAGSGAAGTITLGSDISAYSLALLAPGSGQYTFAVSPYQLGLGAGGLFAMADATVNTLVRLDSSQIWEIDTGKTLTLGGVISGTSALTKMGRGTLVLNAANNWQGAFTTVDGLVVQNASQTFSDSARLNIGADAVYRIAGGTLTVGANGIENSGTYQHAYGIAGFSVNQGGKLVFARTDSSIASPELMVTGGWDARIGPDIILEAGLHHIAGKNSGDTLFTGAISGSGGIAVTNGIITLIGNNTAFTGDLVVRKGALQLEGYNPIAGGNRLSFDVASGATGVVHLGGFDRTISDLSSAGAGAARIANWTGASSAATLTVNQRVAGSFSGVISDGASTAGGNVTGAGALALRKTGTGTLALTGANTYTGGTTIEQGTVRILGGGNLGSGAVKLAGGTLSFEQTQGLTRGTIAGANLDTTTAPSGGVYTNNLSDLHTPSSISGVSGINRTFTGQIYLTAGSWAFGENFDDAAYLKINGVEILNNTSWSSGSYGGITIATSGWYDIDLRVANSGGGGPMGDEGWSATSGIGIRQGAVVTGATAGSSYTTFDLAGLNALGVLLRDVNTFGNAVELVANSSIEVLNTYLADAEVLLTGAVTGTGDLTKTGTGTLTFAGTANTYSGVTRVTAGTVAAGAANAFSARSAIVLANTAGVALALRGYDQTIGSLAGGGTLGGSVSLGSATLTTGADNTSTAYAGVISGTGSLVKTGTGTQTLSGKNTYTGATVVRGGSLVLDFSAGSLTSDIVAAGSALTLDGGTLQIKGRAGATLTQNFAGLTLGNGANTLALNANGATSLVVDIGAITRTGSGTINFDGITGATGNARVKTTSGTAGSLLDGGAQWATVNGTDWAVKDATNTYIVAYTGYTDVFTGTAGGTVVIPNAAAANVRIREGGAGVNTLAATNTAVGSLFMSAGVTAATVDMAGKTLTVGANSGAIAVAKGAKGLTLGTAANSGALTVGSTTGAKTLTLIANNASAADGILVNAVIKNNGVAGATTALVVSGGVAGGTVTLAGANTYTGGTSVTNAGTLRLGAGGATGALGSGTVTLEAGASLAFNRTDTALVVANAIGGSGTVRQIASGTTTLTGANTYSGGTRIDSGSLRLSGSGSYGTGEIVVAAGASAGVSGASAVTVANVVSGSGAFVMSGTGTATLTGANTYSGGTTVSAGTLQVGDGGTAGTAGTGGVSVASGATFAINRSDAVTLANTVSGAGRLAHTGTGVLTVNSANTHTGGTLIGSATLRLTGAGTLGTGTVTDNGTLHLDTDTTLALANAVSGSGRLLVDGAGVTTLTGANTYAGETRLMRGTLRIGDGGSLGSGNIVVNGTLDFAQSGVSTVRGSIVGRDTDLLYTRGLITHTGSGATVIAADSEWIGEVRVSAGEFRLGDGGAAGRMNAGRFTVGSLDAGAPLGGATLVFDTSSVQRPERAIQGSGAVRQAGTGTVVFATDNTYAGGTTVEVGGTLQVGEGGGSGNIGTGGLTLDGTLVSNRDVKLDYWGSVVTAWTISGAITGSGTLRQTGPGRLAITADGDFSGRTLIESGVIQLGNNSAAGSLGSSAIDIASGAALHLNRNDTSLAISGVISGTGTINKYNGGTVSLTADNTFAGATNINSGILQLGNGGTLGSLGTSAIVNNATLSFNRSDTFVFGNAVSGTGRITQAGTGTVIVTSNLTNTGKTTVNAGATLQLGNGGTTGSLGTDWIDNYGTLVFNRSDNHTFASAGIYGSGAVVVAGSGVLTFLTNNNYNGVTTVNAGSTLQIGNGGTTGSLSNSTPVINGTLLSNRSDSWTISKSVSGSGTLRQIGSGTLVINANGTFSGNAFVDAGTLRLNYTGGLGTAALTVNAAGTLDHANGGASTLAGALTLNGGAFNLTSGGTQLTLANTLAITADSTLRLNTAAGWWVGDGMGSGLLVNGLVSGSGMLTIDGYAAGLASVGEVVFGNDANTYSGMLRVGNITAGADAKVVALAAENTLRYATLNLNATASNRDMVEFRNITRATLGGLTGTALSGVKLQNSANAAVALTVNNGVANTYAGILSGTGSLTKTGAGTLTLTGANTYTGGTTVSGAALALDFSAAGAASSNILAASGAVTLTGGSTLRIIGKSGQNGVVQTFASITGGAGANTIELVRNGATTLDVNVGAVMVSGGTLNFKGGTGTAAGARFITSMGAGLNDGKSQLSGESALWNDTQFASVQNVGGVNYIVAWSGTYADVYTGGTALQTTVPNNPAAAVRILENAGTGALTLAAATTTVNSLMMTAGTTAATLDTAGKTLVVGTGAGSSWNITLTATAKSLTLGKVAGDGFLTSGSAAGVSTLAFSNLNPGATLTVNAVIKDNGAGATAVRVAGTGVTVFNAANTYTGGTTIATGGTLLVNASGGVGTGAIANDGTLDLRATGTVANAMSGAGSLMVSGTGTSVTLTAANGYSGNTVIGSGATLLTTGVGTIGAGNVVNDGLLHFGAAGYTYSGSISGSGALAKSGAGELRLRSASTYSGGTTINGSLIAIDHGSALGTGTVTLAGTAASTLTVKTTGNTVANDFVLNKDLNLNAGGGAANFTGRFTGAGRITVNTTGGPGHVFSGDNSYTGGTYTTGGAAAIYGAHANAFGTGPVTMSVSGGTLGGFANFRGAVTMGSGTTLAPGAASGIAGTAGVMNFSAGLALNTGSNLQWNFDGNTLATPGADYGRIAITAGTMTIASGVTLKMKAGAGVDYANAYWDSHHSLLIADASGSGLITGTFALDTSGAGAFAGRGAWSLNYTGGDVYAVWTAIPEPSTYGLGGATALGLIALVRRRRKPAGV